MAKAKNRVIAGDNNRHAVQFYGNGIHVNGFTRSIHNYELITDEKVKSAASGVARGPIGGVLLGPVGMLVGVSTGKSKGIYTVAIEYGDGMRSLVEVDDKMYKEIVKGSF